MKPRFVDVKGQRCKIKYIKGLKEDSETPAYGYCHKDEKVIALDASLEGDIFMRVLAHECCHAVLHECHLDIFISDELEEAIVRCFEDFFWDKIDF